MKFPKSLAVSLAFSTVALFGAQTASAAPMNLTDGDKIKLDWVGNYGGASGGGAFTASGVGTPLSGMDTFLTFCLEYSEHISLGTAYFVDVNTKAVGGGSGVLGTYVGDLPGSTGAFDPLSSATAWLYTQYRNNGLGHGITQNNSASANAVQLAIWGLENEVSSSVNSSIYNSYSNTTKNLANSLITDAINATTGATPSWSGLGNVRVLNLYTGYSSSTGLFTGNKQSQLYIAPIPEPEIYAMLAAGLGLMGVVARRRKRLDDAVV